MKTLKPLLDLYSELGIAVLPAIYGAKRPKLEWKKFQEKGPTDKEVKKWFKSGEKQNIAVLCGVPSRNLVVLDFDDVSIYPKFFDDTETLERETLVVKTGRGNRHVYLRTDKPIPSFKIPKIKLEVRSNGNIVIAPPSKHPNGQLYKFVNPDVKYVMEVNDLVNAVWKKAEKLGLGAPIDLFGEGLSRKGEHPYEGVDPPCISTLLKGVNEGIRNEVAMRLVSFWMKFKQDADSRAALKRLKRWNILNKPPLPESELKHVVESVKKLDRSYGCRVNQAWCDVERCPLKKKQLLWKKAEEDAAQLLSSPNVLAALTPHLDNIVAGEDDNKKLVFILLLSGKVRDPTMKQMILLKGEPGCGKSTVMRIANAFETKSVGRFTAHALDYANLQDFEVLKLQELGSMDQEFQGVSTIKFLSPDDRGYTVEYTDRDEKGRFGTKQHRVPPITLISSTTRIGLDPQLERRAWVINPDETKAQTDRVRAWKANFERERGLVSLGIQRETNYDHSLRVLEAVVTKILQRHPILMFPKSLTKLLKADVLRVRGDFDKLFVLVKLYALLESWHLPRAKGKNGSDVVFVTPQSAFQALKVALKPFVTMTTELEERSRKLLEILQDQGCYEAGDTVNHEMREKIAARIGRSERTVYRYLKEWCNAAYMSMTRGSKGNPTTFKLIHDLDVVRQKSSVVLDITNASRELASEMKKEIEDYLSNIVDKLRFAEGWSIAQLRDAMGVVSGNLQMPIQGEFLSTMPDKERLDLLERKEKNCVPASEMSRIKDSNSEKKPGVCFVCHKLLPPDLRDCTVVDCKGVHIECYGLLKAGRRDYAITGFHCKETA